MTFRIDDLLVPVLPRSKADEEEDPQTAVTNTVCADSQSCAYGPCDTPCEGSYDEPKKEGQAWRQEQFASLARELEDALAR